MGSLSEEVRKFGVMGKGCNKKNSLIKCLEKNINFKDSRENAVLEIKIRDEIRLIDTPFKV